ncbi:MAG: Uma2 family endonuclease [Chloroflexota bacterium]|nr:Uma2 family endonuclease [Chloroflexota bacterium]
MTIASQVQTLWPRMRELPLVLRLLPAIRLSDDDLFALCALNRELRIERTAEGDLLLMPPTGAETGDSNAEIGMQLRVWAKRDGTGTTFDSSTGFLLPNGAMRSPDASWMPRPRLNQMTREQRKKFIPACPDFVLELRSPSDTMADLHAKLREYIANGARLGWLLDPETRRVHVYRPDAPVEQLDDPATVGGDPVLPGFVLDLREVW